MHNKTPIDGIWVRSFHCLSGCEDGLLTDTGHHSFTKGAGVVSFFDPNT